MSALKTVFNAEPVRTSTKTMTTATGEFELLNKPTTPEVVAGYVRLVLTVVGTLATILPGLEVVGVPVSEWIRVVFGSTC